MFVQGILRLSLLILSGLGYCELLRRKTNIEPAFFPSAVIAMQTVGFFWAGILGFLTIGTAGLFLLGLALLVHAIWRDRNLTFVKHYLSVEYGFLLGMSLLVWGTVRDRMFTHYDNFSHWALVVNNMLATNRFPNFLDTLIAFQEYPLGSAGYLYYVAKVLGKSEPVMMFAQAFMMLAAVMPIFTFCRKNKFRMAAVAVFGVNFILVFNIPLDDLLVDTLLPLVGMCGLVFLYRNQENLRHNTIAFWVAAAYLVQMTQIKNSGLFFFGIACVGLLLKMRREKQWKDGVSLMAIPLVLVFLWKRHCKYVFDGSSLSKHAMTLKYMLRIVSQKNVTSIGDICGEMLRYSVANVDVWAVLLVMAAVLLLCVRVCPEKKKRTLLLGAACLAVYGVYQAAMTGMYIFSMPNEEAAALASAGRYTRTILIAGLYVGLCLMGATLSQCSRKGAAAYGAVYIGLLSICMVATMGQFTTIYSETDKGESRVWMEDCIARYELSQDGSYRILVPQETDGYLIHMSRYLLRTTEVDEVVAGDTGAIENCILLVPDPTHPAVQDWVRTHFPEQLGNPVIFS